MSESESAGAGGKHWLPIESNPEVMNEYAGKLGWPTEALAFHDVLSTDDWALEMLPQPVRALLMLFPICAASEAHASEEADRIAEHGQVVDPKLFYCKQTIDNACGTIGMLHVAANLSSLTGGDVPLAEGSFFHDFVSTTLDATPEERAEKLEGNRTIDEAHAEVAVAGVSEVVQDTHQHFIAFVSKGGRLYELDGRKKTPIDHGATTDETFLQDAVKVVREFMARDPEELRFTLVAVAPPAPAEEA